MSRKHTKKQYVENGYYHIYNRGNNKQILFRDDQDYQKFTEILATYLLQPKEESFKKNYFNSIELLCFCLMPNHFHLLIKQENERDIANFMRSLSTSYSYFFRNKYLQIGRLFESRYKAILIKDDSYLLYVSKYIHVNPKAIYPSLTQSFSSYSDYLGITQRSWVSTSTILNFFYQPQTQILLKQKIYKNFVEEKAFDNKILISHLLP